MEPKLIVAGIDVHKRMLAVVIVDDEDPQQGLEQRKFGTGASELKHPAAWLGGRGVTMAVLESTAQYWRPVWQALEQEMRWTCIWGRPSPTRRRAAGNQILRTRCGWRAGFWRRSLG